ncbi:hypothetical protein KCU92_g248, partial [Aureobasidium melanogenum]
MNSTRHRLRDISTLCDTIHIHLSQHFVDSLDNISLLQYFMHNLSFLSPILADFGSESSFPHNDVSHCTQRSELCERLLEKSGLRFNDESWGRWKHESAVGSGGPDQKANRGVSTEATSAIITTMAETMAAVLQRAEAVPPIRVESSCGKDLAQRVVLRSGGRQSVEQDRVKYGRVKRSETTALAKMRLRARDASDETGTRYEGGPDTASKCQSQHVQSVVTDATYVLQDIMVAVAVQRVPISPSEKPSYRLRYVNRFAATKCTMMQIRVIHSVEVHIVDLESFWRFVSGVGKVSFDERRSIVSGRRRCSDLENVKERLEEDDGPVKRTFESRARSFSGHCSKK